MSIPSECPLCMAGADQQDVTTSHVFGLRKEKNSAFFHCNNCDVRYQFPALTPQEEAEFYTAEFEGFMAERSGATGGWQKAEMHVAANELTRQRRMVYLNPYLSKTCYVLEVGCSSGFMLYPLIKSGHECIGVEPSGVFRDFVVKQEIPVYDSIKKLSESIPESRFDLIIHFFVLEHIADPLEFLMDQLKLLRPGGKIIFEIPNAADPIYSIYDIPAFERFYWSKAHPWYFSEKSLNFLLGQLGLPYEILREQRYDLSNHMVWARDGRPGGMGRFSDVLGAEFDKSYKQALIESGKCDTLIGIITKK